MEILYCDDRIVVCVKPAGVLSTDEPGGMPELVRNALGDREYVPACLGHISDETKIVLNLEDDEAVRVQDTLKLTDAEIMNITRFERGSGLISTNSNHITVEFKASSLEKQLITTDRHELSQILEQKKM